MSQTALRSLADHFADQAERRPDAAALIWDGEPVSYDELAAMANSAYAELEDSRLPRDRPVGIRAKKSPEAIALILGCLRGGYPFLLPSIELAPETLAQLFAQAGTSQVVSPHGPRSESAASLRALVDDVRSEPQASDSEWPPVGGGEDVTFMLTTSGSTGLPKIVPLTAAGIDAFTDWAAEQFEIRPGTVVANYAPLNFDLCLLDIWATLKHGGCVAMVDQDRATQGAYLADLVNDNQVNVLQAVPMLYRLLIDVNREDGRTFPTVRHVIATGDKIPATSLAELPKLFPNARFYNVYGCTETNDSLIHEFRGLEEGNVPTNVPVGQPISGVIARVQTEDGTALEGTGTGEFMVWTPFQTRGYLKSSLNQGKFVTLEDDNGRTYYKSGDIVRRHEDGTLTLEGRADFYVKVRGVRVSTQVVEQAIQEHPAVIEVAVIAVPDDLAGARLHATVRREADVKLNSLMLRQHCATRLARTEMPSTIEIVTEPLPKTSTGKVDRKAIAAELERSRANG
ncbi:MAG TPA: AMP-binding protein [Solirubrobacteraceae bacterium]|nr:AMP-binding protein [Solirubrobacteraceae bacterium]